MEWMTVIGLVILGIGLIVIEIIFVPGSTIVGIAGFMCTGLGIYLGYDYFGSTVGTGILVASVLVSLVVMVYALKSRSWERFSLKDENTGRFNDEYRVILEVGAEGLTISSLRPIGKAIFGDKELEVRSNGGYIGENQKVKIIRIDSNKIIVEPI